MGTDAQRQGGERFSDPERRENPVRIVPKEIGRGEKLPYALVRWLIPSW